MPPRSNQTSNVTDTFINPTDPALLAGMSALSRRTMIADDRLPTYALPLAIFQDFLEKGACVDSRDAENATARMEIWSYNPHLLSKDPIVDPLSLYLSLRDSADERVQQQLEQLITVCSFQTIRSP